MSGKYVDPPTARVKVANEKGKIIIIHGQKDDYYKLSGGGIRKCRRIWVCC